MRMFSEYVDSVEQGLLGAKFRVSRDVTLKDGSTLGLAARRNAFVWKGLTLFSQHILIAYRAEVGVADLSSLFRSGLEYAKGVNRIPLPRGLQFGYMIIPCVVGTTVEGDVVDVVVSPPKKHWAIYEYPVSVNLTSGQAHYFTGRSAWGALFFSELRTIAADFLDGPAASSGG